MNIRKTLKRLIDDTQYVAALEKQNNLLKENLQNRVDVGDYSPSTSHCTVRTGLVYGATYI